jgi:hypothetical protein
VPTPWTIAASAGPHGAISPAGSIAAYTGDDVTFTLTAEACYTAAGVSVDGGPLVAGSSYTFTNVQSNHTIEASFTLNGPYTITAAAGTGGSIDPSGAVSVACGAGPTFTIASTSCYHIADVLVDGGTVGPVASYTFANVQSDHTIAASFAANPSTITPVTGLAAVQVTTGNDASGTTKITLTFTRPAGADSVKVWRKGYGNYPLYDDAPGSGSVPAVPGAYPPAGWTLTEVTASGQTDHPATRDYWYYVAYAKDACDNVSAVSTMTTGTLGYQLGDVSDGTTIGKGNNVVSTADVSLLGDHYGLSGGALAGFEYLDVGPTTTRYTDGRPTTDSRTDFEDLMMYAINYTPQVSLVTKGAPVATQSANVLGVLVPVLVSAGEFIEVPVELSGVGDLMAVSVTLRWDAAVVEPLDVAAGDLITSRGGVVLSPGPGRADAALLGASQGITGQGVMAIVRFRARAAGNPGIVVAQVLGRDALNQSVQITIATPLAVEQVVSTTALTAVLPNPARGSSIVQFSLATRGPVDLSVYSVDGRHVKTLAHGVQEVGLYRLTWDGSSEVGARVQPGIYYVRMNAGRNVFTRTIVRLQ